ncbi:hypothetical protein ID850_16930 [Xenorhabdus sp. Flor]|uniref:hypothetical protein n=1 Tax=Xenorhabdus cabanillasii TaxID=351673 RepID=UPI0019C0FD00|nr:hypothetical protein [Xenorhabdus sp. Flor]MBD2816385.1 hypothetical protein [Xenorhabdus sp. Flor]
MPQPKFGNTNNSFNPTTFMNWLPFYNVYAEYWQLVQIRTTCPHGNELTIAT